MWGITIYITKCPVNLIYDFQSTFIHIAAVAESLFEGDIVLSSFDLRFVDTREEGDVDGDLKQSLHKRNAKRNRMVLWQDKVIPYEFDTKLPCKKKHIVDKITRSELEFDFFT